MVVAEFLASDEAEDLSDRRSASRCADHIVDYGCDRDFGRPLRMSPAKAETFLLGLAAPAGRAVARRAARDAARAGRLGALEPALRPRARPGGGRPSRWTRCYDSMGAVHPASYHDPACVRPGLRLVARLLPDCDLEALAPRGRSRSGCWWAAYSGQRTCASLRPGGPERTGGRCSEPPTTTTPPGRGGRLDEPHRCWPTGSGAATRRSWDGAQRLLDPGEDRHSVLHTLMAVLDHTSLATRHRDRRAPRAGSGHEP